MSMNQRTIRNVISISGKGLHTGKKVKITLNPAPPDYGIVFKRTDLKKSPEIKAHASNVVDTTMATTLGKDDVRIATVEHLLSALLGFQVDNIHIEVDGPEIPILDGSASEFSKALLTVGLKEQKELKKFLVITKPIAVRQQDRFSYLFPSDEFKITCRIEFSHKCIGKQRFDMSFPVISSLKNGSSNGHEKSLNGSLNGNGYAHEISHARTFGFIEEVATLQKMGLALGGGLDNAIVLNKDSVINEDGLRWKDEFVRHKVLDAMGDVALLGYQILGHLVTYRSGHSLHHQLVQKTLRSKNSWKMMTSDMIFSKEEEFLQNRSYEVTTEALSA